MQSTYANNQYQMKHIITNDCPKDYCYYGIIKIPQIIMFIFNSTIYSKTTPALH